MVKKATIILVAAGSGLRFGAPLPKQFCLLNGVPVIVHCIRNLRATLHPDSWIIVVLNKDYFELWRNIASQYKFQREDFIVAGGDCRAESVANALEIIDSTFPEIIMVHDAVRPFVNSEIISRLFKALENKNSYALPVVPVTDSLREVDDKRLSFAVNRNRFRAVQTPQAFHLNTLKRAYSIAREDYRFSDFTDDASVVERCLPENECILTEGSPYNLKITNPLDLKIAEVILNAQSQES